MTDHRASMDLRTPGERTNDGGSSRLLEIAGLVKHYPVSSEKAVVMAVNDVSFHVDKGETLGLVGESGSGKTTVAHCILNLTELTGGSIVFNGREIGGLSSRASRALRKDIQLVFQEPYDSLNPRLRIETIIAEPLVIRKVPKAEQLERVRELLELVHLPEEILDLYPHEISQGLQQRVGIARAFATDPKLVVLDEPTSALDPRARRQIIELLMELQERTGISYLFITHDLNTLRQIAHRVAVMYLGRIVEEGQTADLFEQQRHPYTRALLSSVLYPDPDTRRERFELAGEIPSPINLPAGCALASRCPLVIEDCRRATPPLVALGEGRSSACLRYELVPNAKIVGLPDRSEVSEEIIVEPEAQSAEAEQ